MRHAQGVTASNVTSSLRMAMVAEMFDPSRELFAGGRCGDEFPQDLARLLARFRRTQEPLCQCVAHEPKAVARLPFAAGANGATARHFSWRRSRSQQLRTCGKIGRAIQREGLAKSIAAELKQTTVPDRHGEPASADENQPQKRGEGPLFPFRFRIPRQRPAVHIRRPLGLQRR